MCLLVAQEALARACEYIRTVRADMGGTNVLDPLIWILRQPVIRGHPRLLFLLTDGAVSNTGKVIELVRRHARYIRHVEGANVNLRNKGLLLVEEVRAITDAHPYGESVLLNGREAGWISSRD